jgi:threonine dehydrogenase-like Zn-dependent dehydrogenase
VRAVAITGDRTAAVVDIDRPAPTAGEVLLDVSYCGICGSDLHMLGMPASLLANESPAVVIDTTGHTSGAPLAVGLLPPAGRLTVVGLPDDPAPIDLALLAVKELTVGGSLCYDGGDFAEALGHLAAGRIPCRQIITTIASLEEAPARLAGLGTGTAQEIKILLRPGHPA